MSQQTKPTSNTKMGLPSSSTFSFTAPFPTTTTVAGPQVTGKQRRVSLALPSSPRLVPAWSFRDDTTLDSHVASGSPLAPEKKGKMRRIASDDQKTVGPEKRQRKKWTEEETQMLVNGCNIWGVGNWKAILNDPNLKFDSRSPVDLKDRFRTFFPDAYKLHYPNAKTHLSSKVRSTLPDGTSLFEKTRSKKRRPFTTEEDQALKAGYEKYGTVWSTIVKDPIFQEQKRRSTDLRDRFRNAFPHLYQAAGYKPRSMPKKKRGDVSASLPRATADDQLVPSRMTNGPARRRRSRTTPGYSYSVPQSTACSEDEDSSDDDDDVVEIGKPSFAEVREVTPQPEDIPLSPEAMLNEVTMHTIDQTDPLADMSLPDFMPDSSQALSDTTEHSVWSSGQHSPPQADSWSSAATTTTASPTSSQISMADYFMRDSSFNTFGRRDGSTMIGKSAWGPSDWMSANPRLDQSGASTSSNSSFVGGPSPPPSSPFSFSQLSHGIMDRYDLFQNTAFAHDFASEAGLGDSHSTFSDPELFPSQSMRGFTHHSNYAGDLIFGARTHQPQPSMHGHAFGLNGLGAFGLGGSGLGLSGMGAPEASINPMQLHTPSLQGIDELELMAIRLDDTEDEPMVNTSTTAEVGVQKDDESAIAFDADLSSLIHLPPQTLEEIAGLSAEVALDMERMAATPPATPAQSGRASRELHGTPYSTLHNRSMSVPPFERVQMRPTQQQGHATPQPPPTRSLSLFDIPAPVPDNDPTSQHSNLLHPSSFLGTSFGNDSFKSLGESLSDLLFLDLHYPMSGGLSPQHHDIIEAGSGVDEARKGQALDLAQSYPLSIVHQIPAAGTVGTLVLSGSSSITGSAIGRTMPTHHRGQSAVSPKDLLLSGNDNKRKRASWDGGPG